jgi:tryptophan synthase alpha chain
VGELQAGLRARIERGGKCFVPYVTAGLPGVDAGLLRSLEGAGADAVEVGIPFSDPIMDGGVIQEASRLALERGTHPGDALALVRDAALDVPVAFMTYLNLVWHRGVDAFLAEAAGSGIRGAIVPDLPVDEADDWIRACAENGIEPVFLVAPAEAESRRRLTAERGAGFVYCVATYGVTGERGELASTAEAVVASMRPLTDHPLLLGVGIGSPEQAAQACAFADGVIVGSAIVRRLVEGDRDGAIVLAEDFRAAIPLG